MEEDKHVDPRGIHLPWGFNIWFSSSLRSFIRLISFRAGCNHRVVHGNPSTGRQKIFREKLGGGFKYFLFSSLFGEDSHFD